jgi:hypothetical protein
VIGFLRFVGIINAAIWFGAAVFFTFGAGPAVFSQDMENFLLLKPPTTFRYVAGGIAQVLIARYFRLQLVCGIIALFHLLAERLYSGKSPQKFATGLLVALLSITLFGAYWIQPKLKQLHTTRYAVKSSPETREAAAQSFRAWHGASQALNLLMLGGLAIYLWRVANPPDSTRFLITPKFRG